VKSTIWLRAAAFILTLTTGVLVQAAGPLQRVPATTLAMPSAPPSYSYTNVNAFGSLTFFNPVVIATPPGETNRVFIVEKNGVISVITNLAAPTRTVFLQITNRVISQPANVGGSGEQGLLGLAFHPGYATNGYFYVFYTGTNTTSAGAGTRHDILSRFTVSAGNSNLANSASEQYLIRQNDEAVNHNGGDLHFGPDGYLYVSLGDEGGGDDQYNNSQTITKDFFAGMLRIDVDKRPGNLNPQPHASVTAPTNYFVPVDNPFVHTNLGGTWNGVFNGSLTPNLNLVRNEFWAVGLRNPWRFSFDLETGWLYCGDVGQNQREEVDIIVRGGNYGWAFREGIIAGPKAPPVGFTSINPILDYSHAEGISITGGVVYRGERLTELHGAYIFGDYGGSGRVWATRYNGVTATPRQLLLSDTGIAGFGRDPSNGDLLYADVIAGTVQRLIRNTATSPVLPATLAATGAFTNLATLTPHAGVVPYDLNVPFWSDNAHKTRWFTVTNINQFISFDADGNWSFPNSSIWIKHFELELTNGVPASRKRLETRFIVRTTTGGVYGATYRWGDSLTNATLVPDEGLDETFVVNDGGGILRTQIWHYPSRTECVTCHTAAGGYALGFNTPQLNREFDYSGEITNQIEALSLAGYFVSPVTNRHLLRTLAHATNEASSLEYRVRSYLDANCANCHQPGGTSQALWDARLFTAGPANGIINGALLNSFGSTNNRVVVPGSLSNSVLFQRVANLGPGHMPPLATSVMNTQAVELLSAWITNELSGYQSYADWQLLYFGSTNSPDAQQLADADIDRARNYLEYLTGTVPTNAASAWGISVARSNGDVQIIIPQVANRAFEVQATTNLLNASSWSPVNLPANAPSFPRSNRTAIVEEAIQSGVPTYYRARVYEP
jgi:glucose/arabinose dehydrogenase/mono/diheme cytochrome c family protein